MRTGQREISVFIVIKAPQSPSIGAMALLTFLTHRAFVHIILLVTAYALAFCLMKLEIIMTTLAWGAGMHTLEG